jgi:ArsR family transcriptional regulator
MAAMMALAAGAVESTSLRSGAGPENSVFGRGVQGILRVYNYGVWRKTELMGIDDTFKALADPTRRQILRLLRDRDLTAGELAEHFDLARSTMSGHFNVLKGAGLVVSERSRNNIVYSINMSAFDDVVSAVASFVEGRRRRGDGAGAGPGSSQEMSSG